MKRHLFTHLLYPLITDGDIQDRHLKILHKDIDWLMAELAKNNIQDSRTVFFCVWEDNRLHIQLKEN